MAEAAPVHVLDCRGDKITWNTSGTRLRQDQLLELHRLLLEEDRWVQILPHLRKYDGRPNSDLQNKVFYITRGQTVLNVWLSDLPTLDIMYNVFLQAQLEPLMSAIVRMVEAPVTPHNHVPSAPERRMDPPGSTSMNNLTPNLSQTEYRYHPHGQNSQKLTARRLATLPIQKVLDMTNHFDTRREIGRGRFGVVYEGKRSGIYPPLAIKRLVGEKHEEFRQATTYLYLKHDSIVALLGTCLEGNERILIYELMINKDLARHLGDPSLRQQLVYQRRFLIAEDVIKGLSFINQTQTPSGKYLVHRDIKSANILLDQHLRAKIGDFGSSTQASRGTGETEVQYAGMIISTPGYMAPEMTSDVCPSVSTKVDTFAFGVVVAELYFGQLISENPDLLKRLGPTATNAEPDNSITWGVEIENSNFDVVSFLLDIARYCTTHDWVQRPLTREVESAFSDRQILFPRDDFAS